DLGPQRALDQLLADRRDAVGGRRQDPGLLDRGVDALRLLAVDLARPACRRHPRALADLERDAGRDPREVALQTALEVAGRRVAEHLHQHAQLDAVRVRLDLGGGGRQLLRDPRQHERLLGPLRRAAVHDVRVRVRERDLPHVGVHRVLAAAPVALELDLDAGAVRAVPGHDLVALHARLVALGVDHELDAVGGAAGAGARGHRDRPAGGEQAVHAGGADADALLAAALAQAV